VCVCVDMGVMVYLNWATYTCELYNLLIAMYGIARIHIEDLSAE